MRNPSLILIAGLMISMSTFAIVTPPIGGGRGPSRGYRPVVPPRGPVRPGPIRPGPVTPPRWGRANPPPRYGERGRFFNFDGREFINVPDTCNANYVRFSVHGDSLVINSLQVLFENGETQQLAFRGGVYNENFRHDWIDLSGMNRCIMGFYIDAYSIQDWDNQGSYVALFASVTNYDWNRRATTQEVSLGNIYIADWNSHRGFVRPPLAVHPPAVVPVHPIAPPIVRDPPAREYIAPTVRMISLDQWQRAEYFSHVLNFNVSQSFVTEIKVLANDKNDIEILSAAYKDSVTGRIYEIPSLKGVTVYRNSEIAARIYPKDGTAMVQSVSLEVRSHLGNSRGMVNLAVGLAR